MSNSLVLSDNRVSSSSIILGDDTFNKVNAFSAVMCASNMIPAHFKNMNVDCSLVIMKALSLGLDPIAFSHEVFPVNGKMNYGSKAIIAMLHTSKVLDPRTFTEFVGDWDNKGALIGNKFANEKGLGVKVGFRYAGDKEVTWGQTLWLADQTIRNSPLWKTDPATQMTYLAAKRWANINMPALIMGMSFDDAAETEHYDEVIKPANKFGGNGSNAFEDEKSGVIDAECNVVDVEEYEAQQAAKAAKEAAEAEFAAKEAAKAEKVAKEKADKRAAEIKQLEEEKAAKELADKEAAETAEMQKKADQQAKESAELAEKLAKEKAEKEAEIEEVKVDSNGVAFDAEIHTGTTLKDGKWRMKKGAKAPAVEAPTPAVEVVETPVVEAVEVAEVAEAVEAKTESTRPYGVGDWVKATTAENEAMLIKEVRCDRVKVLEIIENGIEGEFNFSFGEGDDDIMPSHYEGFALFEKCEAPAVEVKSESKVVDNSESISAMMEIAKNGKDLASQTLSIMQRNGYGQESKEYTDMRTEMLSHFNPAKKMISELSEESSEDDIHEADCAIKLATTRIKECFEYANTKTADSNDPFADEEDEF